MIVNIFHKLHKGCNSDSLVVKREVSQGSVLVPLLFLVYFNNLSNASSLDIRMFDDDTVLFCSHKNSQNVQAITNNELHKVSKWFCSNKLSLSLNKTKYMILSKSKTNEHFSFKINDFEIVQTHSYKYLGVIIDDKDKIISRTSVKRYLNLVVYFIELDVLLLPKYYRLLYYASVFPPSAVQYY